MSVQNMADSGFKKNAACGLPICGAIPNMYYASRELFWPSWAKSEKGKKTPTAELNVVL